MKKKKTVNKPDKDVYKEYRKTYRSLVFIDRKIMTLFMDILKETIPDSVLKKKPRLKELLDHVDSATKSQNEVRKKLDKHFSSDKT